MGTPKGSIEVLNKFSQEKYNGQYIFSGEYIKSTTKVDVYCTKHDEHFKMRPDSFKGGQIGCPKCIKEKLRKSKYSQEDIIQKIKDIHGDKYDLSEIHYKDTQGKIKLICPKHGTWETKVNGILSKGYGCPKCRDEENGKRKRLNISELKDRSNINYNNKYEVKDIKWEDTCWGLYYCKDCKEMHWQRAYDHPKYIPCSCAEQGYKKEKDSLLYYFEFLYENKLYYKIGVTNRTVKDRYRLSDINKITNQIIFPMKGSKALEWEKLILETYHEYRLSTIGTNIKPLDSCKNYEIFVKDVLGCFT